MFTCYVVGNNVIVHSIWLDFRGNHGVELTEKLTEGCDADNL